jgi:calcineurin-like phosphoesterase family protein
MRTLSRREWLRLATVAAVGLESLPVFGQEKPASEGTTDLSFVCVNDLHYSAKTEAPFFRKMVDKMKAVEPKPKLLMVVGDLVEKGTAAEFEALKEILAESGMTLRVVVGNHDWASNTDRKAFEEAFPNSLDYSFELNGWQWVCLDSTNGINLANQIQKATFDWLDANLDKLDKKKPMILVTHYPLGPGVRNRSGNAEALLKRFKDYNLKASFNGHYHAFTETKYNDVVITTGRCCSVKAGNHDNSKEKGFFACVAKQDGALERKFVAVEP